MSLEVVAENVARLCSASRAHIGATNTATRPTEITNSVLQLVRFARAEATHLNSQMRLTDARTHHRKELPGTDPRLTEQFGDCSWLNGRLGKPRIGHFCTSFVFWFPLRRTNSEYDRESMRPSPWLVNWGLKTTAG